MSWGAASVILRHLSLRLDVFVLNGLRALLGAAVVVAWFLAAGAPGIATLTSSRMLLIVGSIVVGALLGDTCNVVALRLVGVSRAVPLTSSFPIFTVLFAFLLWGDAPSPVAILGALLVVGGAGLLAVPERDPPPARIRNTGAADQLGVTRRQRRLGLLLVAATAAAWGTGDRPHRRRRRGLHHLGRERGAHAIRGDVLSQRRAAPPRCLRRRPPGAPEPPHAVVAHPGQVWRSALPGLGNLFLVLLKDTSAQERNCSQLHAGAVYLLLRRGARLPRRDRAVHGGHAGAGAARRPRRGAGRLMATLADVVADSLPRLLEGAWLTVQLVVLALAAGTALALPLAGMRTARRWWLKAPAYGYLFFFRGTPLLVQIFLVYYGLAQFAAVRDSFLWPILREPYWCAVIAFGLNTAAYTAEIIRGGIAGGGARRARGRVVIGSVALGQALRLIVLPRAVRQALPAYGNEVILMLKGSALASTITLLDLTGVARTIIARTYLAVELFALAGLIYLILTMLIVRGVRLLERRLRGVAAARIR